MIKILINIMMPIYGIVIKLFHQDTLEKVIKDLRLGDKD